MLCEMFRGVQPQHGRVRLLTGMLEMPKDYRYAGLSRRTPFEGQSRAQGVACCAA